LLIRRLPVLVASGCFDFHLPLLMPEIIRKTLADRLANAPELHAFMADFRNATGLPVTFFLEDDVPQKLPAPAPQSATHSEAKVPVASGSETLGWFYTGVVLHEVPPGVDGQHPHISRERFASMVRLLEFAAERFSRDLCGSLIFSAENLPESIQKACRYMRENYRQEISLGEVAKAVGLSRDHFCKLFHRSTGLRFTEYLNRVRIEHAKALLRTREGRIAPVAQEVGYRSLSQFNRSFRQLTGASPRDWRSRAMTEESEGQA